MGTGPVVVIPPCPHDPSGVGQAQEPVRVEVVERTQAWLLGCRRLGVRYERRADLLQGLLHLACAPIRVRFLEPATG